MAGMHSCVTTQIPDLNLSQMAEMHSQSYYMNIWLKLIAYGWDTQPLLQHEYHMNTFM